mmetsp:Transcript_36678/g.88943  ORF Transcript_36678/g.88943 Transcript_36678/m.88943 type:complete len:214 (-) Transcript_36678:2477-3118(-)
MGELAVELVVAAVVDSADAVAAVVGATVVAAAVAIVVDGVEHVVVVEDADSVVADGGDVAVAETNLVADGLGLGVAVLPTAAVFVQLLRDDDAALQPAVLPYVYVALLAVVGVAMQPAVPHIYDVDLRLVEPVVPPLVVGVLLQPLDDDVLLLPAFGAHLRQRDDESPLHVVSNVLLPQLSDEPRLPPPVFVSFLPVWQHRLPVWRRQQGVEQ